VRRLVGALLGGDPSPPDAQQSINSLVNKHHSQRSVVAIFNEARCELKPHDHARETIQRSFGEATKFWALDDLRFSAKILRELST